MDNNALMKEADEIRKTPIIFILGNERSGTTLLQLCLNAHPNIIAPPESLFINLLYPRFGKIIHPDKNSISEFVNFLFSEPFFSHLWLLNKEHITQKLLSVSEYADYPLLCKMIFYQMRKNDEKVLLLSDKNPKYSIFIKKLLKIFPEARFVHIVREPRDNVNSNMKRLNKKNAYFLARQWVGYNKYIEKMKRKLPGKFFTIIYEDMVQHTEKTYKLLCEYLQVPYNDLMMNHRFTDSLRVYEKSKYYERILREQQNLLKPINSSNIGKWKYEMNEYDRAVTEIITANPAKKYYGYDMTTDKKIKLKISSFKLFKSLIQYGMWELFTKIRFSSYNLNRLYFKKKKRF